MTSLVLFNSETTDVPDHIPAGVDWGTGKERLRSTHDQSSSHPSGTFLYQGEPTAQNYRNTDLTLSHVRINDELIPAPFHSIDLTHQQIPLKFPSNHPYASHISEKSVFPHAIVDSYDRPSTDTDPYIVTHKSKGDPYRREVHFGEVSRGRLRQNRWPDQQFMHLSRSVSDLGTKPIYPWPKQVFTPNNDYSKENSATNIVKNKERTTMETTYQSDYNGTDGLGSHVIFDTTVSLSPTEKLKPFFNKTLDPARPIDGVQAGHIHGNHRQPSALERSKSFAQETTHLMSENEKLDDHMRNGTDYVNLPTNAFPKDQVATWTPRPAAPTAKSSGEIRYLRPVTTVPQIVRDHHTSHQQMEAENRLSQLELIRPEDNLQLYNQKNRLLQHPRHARPILSQYHPEYVKTFYDQMGNYVQERSGLYQTHSYEPKFLSQSMTELSVPEDPAFKDETHLNDLLNHSEKVQEKSKPKLFQYKALGDYQKTRNRLVNKLRVPLDSTTVDVKTQEGQASMIQRETVYGQSFNTRKFLQENTLSSHARTDPTGLMNTEYNHNLERVRVLNSYPKAETTEFVEHQEENEVDPTKEIVVGPLLPPAPYDELYANNLIAEQTDGYSRRSTYRVYDSPFKGDHETTIYKFYPKEQISVAAYPMKADALSKAAKTVIRLPGPEIVSRSVEYPSEPHSTYQHSYPEMTFHELIAPSMTTRRVTPSNGRLAMKDHDPRFGRTTDGRVKQWKLIDLQDHWTKTNAQRQYHVEHPENVPYVGEATVRANKEIMIADIAEKQRIVTVR